SPRATGSRRKSRSSTTSVFRTQASASILARNDRSCGRRGMDTGDPEENRTRWRRIKMAWRAWRLYDKGSGWRHHSGGRGAVQANVAMAAAVAATATAGTYGAIALRDTYIAPKQAVETAAISPPPAEVRQTKNSVVFAIEGKDKAGRRGTFDVVV